jgi:hypothetical protein
MIRNPVIGILIADRMAQLQHEADQERLAALARSTSNRGRSRQGDRRTSYVGVARLWLSDALRAVARAVRADGQADCPDETPPELTYSGPGRWVWISDRPNAPCP